MRLDNITFEKIFKNKNKTIGVLLSGVGILLYFFSQIPSKIQENAK